MNNLLPLKIIGLAAAYALFGWLGLLLAIPPGFATAVFPSSGIALAAVLVYGYRIWPGVLLGSFLVNSWTGLDAITMSTIVEGGAVSITIGAGAALQAVSGAFLVRRFAGFPNPLANEREVFSLLFLGGPVSCLVNSVIGVLALLAAGKIPASDVFINFGTWWFGDVIGVFIFTPLVLVWTLRPRKVWNPRRLTVTPPIACAFLLTVAAVAFGTNWERQRLKLQFDQQVAPFAPALERTLSNYIGVLHSLEGFYAASSFIDRDEFRIFTDRSFAKLSGLQALSWNPRVLASDRAEFENRTRREGFPDFQITERNADGQLVRADERSEYISVQLIEPFKGNVKAFGYDVASNPIRQKALELARDTGKPIATARITLVQETGRQFGVLAFMPVYRNGLPRDTLEQRRLNLAGYMVGVFRGGDIIKAALQNLDDEGVSYRLFDQTAPAGEQFLMQNLPQGEGIITLEEKGVFGGSTPIGRTFPIYFGGRQWRLDASPTQRYLASHRQENAWFILIGGMLLTSLVGSFVMVLSGRSESLRSLVAERTQDLAKSEKHVRAIVDNAIDGIITINDRGIIQSANPGTENIFGYSCEEIIGQNVSMLTPEPHRSVHDGYLSNYLETGNAKIIGIGREVEGERKDGTKVALDLSVSEFFVGDDHLFLGMVRDISERKEIDRMKSEFVSTVSHELRTPLTSIKGSLGMIAAGALGELPKKARGMMDIAYKNTERLINLVNDILDMEKLESGSMEFHFDEVDLAGLVKQSIEDNKGYAKQHDVTFVLKDFIPAAKVKADANRITQVIANLLSNAAKFSPQGGKVEVSVINHDDALRVCVTDHGPGIPQDFRDKIFGKFAQADSSDTRQKGGTGLGLNISRSIVEKHGGRIGFHTETGVGTTFHFDLPELTAGKDVAETTPRAETDKGLRVLICEDDHDLSQVLSAMLEGVISVIPATTLKEAKKRLKADRFDLVIIDIGLPDGSGLDLLELVKDDGQRLTPVIIFSGQEVSKEVSSKVEAVLVKSRTSNEKLVETIKSLISAGTEVA